MSGTRLFIALAVLSSLAACDVSPPPVTVPEVTARQPLKIGPDAALAPMRLSGVMVDVRRGTPIGSYRFVPLTCRPFSENVIWNSGRLTVADNSFVDIFYEAMHTARYNVVGDPKKLFRETGGEPPPDFLIGARIDRIAMNICDRSGAWGGRPLDRQAGKAAIRVVWQVFDTMRERIVKEVTTEGAASIEIADAVPDGEVALIYQAFRSAVANLAADPDFLRIVSMPESSASLAALRRPAGTPIRFTRIAPFGVPIIRNMDYIRLGTVTISTAEAHGSGFFISPRLILTNFHVVGGAPIVRVTLETGRSVLGEVLRSHQQRDVALVSVEAGGYSPLPWRSEPLRIGEDVYAIGTPLDRRLAGSVTKGIVSAFRSNRAGFEDIQADVDIQAGNSGGPLLDASGNVVGITYAGIGAAHTSVGVNLFIPIRDAIDLLGLQPVDPQTGRPATTELRFLELPARKERQR